LRGGSRSSTTSDSYYGWFDPQELVPFEDHFAENTA
jgi:hypothetical protein